MLVETYSLSGLDFQWREGFDLYSSMYRLRADTSVCTHQGFLCFPPVIISLPDVRMCDASHDDDDDDNDVVVCTEADTKGGYLGPDMRCVLVT